MTVKIKRWMAVQMRETVAIQAVRDAFFSWYRGERPLPDYVQEYEEAKAAYVLPKVIENGSGPEQPREGDGLGIQGDSQGRGVIRDVPDIR
jgi:hypothetical protein